MPTLEFVGQSARDPDNIAANPSRLVNFYREPSAVGGIGQYSLKPVMGTKDFSSLSGVFFRALQSVDGVLWAAIDGTLYEVGELGAATVRGTARSSRRCA